MLMPTPGGRSIWVASATINSAVIWNRTDCCADRLSDYWIFVSNLQLSGTNYLSLAEVQIFGTGGTPAADLALNKPVSGGAEIYLPPRIRIGIGVGDGAVEEVAVRIAINCALRTGSGVVGAGC